MTVLAIVSGGVAVAIGVLVIVAGGGVLMTAFPRQINRRRMKLIGQIEGPDWNVRAMGIFVAAFAIAAAVFIALVAG